jgi:hypothetical protein
VRHPSGSSSIGLRACPEKARLLGLWATQGTSHDYKLRSVRARLQRAILHHSRVKLDESSPVFSGRQSVNMNAVRFYCLNELLTEILVRHEV